MSVTIDSREPKRLIDLLTAKGVPCKRDYLQVGDYLFPGNVVVERKECSDFISSIMDKRIWIQAKNLTQYEHPIISIIVGNKWKSFYYRKGTYIHKIWLSTIATLTAKYNISVVTFEDEDEFLGFITSLEKQLSKEKESVRFDLIARKANNIQERKENTLCAIEGISVKTAKQLLECYGTVKNISNESIENLVKIKGIGEKTAKAIHDTFN
jgi:ERCC4-type nuclease